jgi:quinol monooxygenase YgiN
MFMPGFEKEIKKALAEMATASRKEPGCEQFVANFRNDLHRK